MVEGCRSVLTRNDSESSDITVESSHHNGNATPGQFADWTNEKHNAYLDSLEASFVHQLHGSVGLGGRCSQEKIRGPYLQALSANNCSSTSQLMVLQDGNWPKIKHNTAVNSHAMLENPWICRFTSLGKYLSAASLDSQKHSLLYNEGFYFRDDTTFSCELAGSSEQHLHCHLSHQSSAGSAAEEVTDQNFVDEDQGDRSSSRPIAKRLRTAMVDGSTDDHVVPFGNCHTPNVGTVNRASSEREEQANQDLFSEHTGNFSCPRSHMRHFLRGG